MFIDRNEYRSRQEKARVLIQRRRDSVLLAWSRGASTQDHAADVLYLTGHYTPQDFVPDAQLKEDVARDRRDSASDSQGRWRASGHAAVVVAPGGPVTLITDSAPATESLAIADPRCGRPDIVAATAEILVQLMRADRKTKSSAPQDSFRIAVIGGEALAGRWERALLEYFALRRRGEVHRRR